MDGGRVVIGIHGLANKPPEEEKARWWKAAIREGLARNAAEPGRDFDFDFVYWADLRHETPLDDARNREPYYVAEGLGAFPRHDPDRASTGSAGSSRSTTACRVSVDGSVSRESTSPRIASVRASCSRIRSR